MAAAQHAEVRHGPNGSTGGTRPDGRAGAWDTFASPFARGHRTSLGRPLDALAHALDRAMAPFWNHPALYAVLVVAAIGASVWGFVSFYGDQYGRVPAYAWPFVPDSPLSTVSWIPASLLVKAGIDKRPDLWGKASAFFVNWSAMMNAKVGLWTVFVLLFHYDHFFVPGRVALQWLLVFSHLGMVVFAVLLWRKTVPLGVAGYAGVLGLGLLWDFMDYLYAPWVLADPDVTVFPNGVPNDPDTIPIVGVVTASLTVVFSALLPLGMRLRGPPVAR